MKNNSPKVRSKMLLLGIALMSLCGDSFAQNPSTTVFEDWNSPGATQNSFQRTVVRSKVIGGTTYYYTCGATLNSAGDYDIFLRKTSSAGAVLWSQTYAGTGAGNDYAADVQIDNVGNVYVCGTYYKDATDSNNAVVIKYNTAGTHKWTRTYNGAGSQHDMYTSMGVAGNVIVTTGSTWKGATNKYDILAMRYDSLGNVIWTSTWDHNNLYDGAVNVWAIGTNVFVAGGAQSATTTYKYAVLKMKISDGSMVTATVTGGTAFGIDRVTDMQIDATGNIYVTGGVLNIATLYDFKTVKLDTALNILWSATYDGGSSLDDVASGIYLDHYGNVIVCGYRNSSTTGRDYVTIKYSSGGVQRWVSTFDGGINGADSATCIVVNQTDTNKIYVSGYSFRGGTKDYWTLRYNGVGTLIWDIGFNHVADEDDRATAIALDTLGNVIVTGQNQLKNGTFIYTTVKYVEKFITLPKDTLAFTFTSYEFTENRGQLIHTDTTLASEVKFYTLFRSPQMYFADTYVSYVRVKDDPSIVNADSVSRVDMEFVNANADMKIRPMDVRENYYNFFNPVCPEGIGHTPNYDQLISLNVWNNIDIIYGSNLMGLKHYFVCKPNGGGSSAPQIDLYYDGADSVKIDGNGQLIIYTPLGNIVQPRPAAWQIDGSGNYSSLGWQPDYVILGPNEVGFTNLGSFNTAWPLVIAVDWGYRALSPTTNWNENNVWSTFMRGDLTGDVDVEIGLGSTTTSTGNLVTTGTSRAPNYPTTPGAYSTTFWGAQEVYVTKFSNANNISWSTFIGGFADEVGYDVIEEPNGNFVLFGNTASDNFPTGGTGYQNNVNSSGDYTYYIFELLANGSGMIWSTYFGGYDSEYVNWGKSLDMDAAGNVFITGMTMSNATTEAFPITTLTGAYNQGTHAGGSADGFVAKFDAGRTLVWCTYFGGNGYDDLTGMDVEDGELFITGYTTTTATNTTCTGNTSGGFPICNGGYYQSANQGLNEAYIARFDTNGVLVWSTFFGGDGVDGNTVVLVRGKRICLVGATGTLIGQAPADQCNPTTNGTFPLCNPGGGATFIDTITGGADLFIASFDATSNSLDWCTYYGGPGNEIPQDLAMDASGNLFIGGLTNQSLGAAAVYPGNNYYWQQNNADGSGLTWDGLLVEIGSGSIVTWSTHYGGHTPSLSTFSNEQIGSLTTFQSSELFITGVAGTLNFPYRCDPATAYCHQETVDDNLQSSFCAKFDLTGGVGIEESVERESRFSLYPNPASNQLSVTLSDNIEAGSTFNIYNSVGQVVYTLDLSTTDQNRTFSIDISFLATGFYMARLEAPSGSSTEKFIKQ